MFIRRVKTWPFEQSWKGFSEVDRLRRDLSEFLQSPERQIGLDMPAGVYPFLHVTQDQDHFYIRSEIPGMTLDQLEVSVTGRHVTISGERNIPSEDQNVRYHRREREAGKFRRQFNLPSDVDCEKVEAKYRNGALMVILPKAESSKPRKIAINR